MSLLLGVDTGGTFTDAVLVDSASGSVAAAHKSLTTHHNLAIGINAALDGLTHSAWENVPRAALSTTLATNAALESLGSRVGCILIGYDAGVMRHYRLDRHIRASAVAHVAGRHDIFGEEVTPLDEDALREAVVHLAGEVDALAISSYLAPRNPDHEQRAVRLAGEVTSLPIVAGASLTSHLDSIRRATTATLNARLLAVTSELLDSLEDSVQRHGVSAPAMVVRGDATLMALELARDRPIETLFSGPAASAVGGARLAGIDRAVVVDMGGTSTDVGILHDGRPILTDRGAWLAGWRTAVRAAAVRSAAIGGDSRIRADPLDLVIGPERVVPLSRAAHQEPEIRLRLAELDAAHQSHRLVPVWEFFAAARPLADEVISAPEQRVLEALAHGPLDVLTLAKQAGARDARLLPIDGLIARRLITRIGLTPTDLLHVRGEYTEFDVEAATIASRIAARESRADPKTFVARAHEAVVRALCTATLRRAISARRPDLAESDEQLGTYLLDTSASPSSRVGPLDVGLRLTLPLIALGAAGAAWLPQVARRLHTEAIVPDHAAVASAVGAASTRIVQEVEVLLRPQYLRRGGAIDYAVHSPEGRVMFASEAQAREHALAAGRRVAAAAAASAGAHGPSIDVDERRWSLDGDDPEAPAHLMETRFRFTATEPDRV